MKKQKAFGEILYEVVISGSQTICVGWNLTHEEAVHVIRRYSFDNVACDILQQEKPTDNSGERHDDFEAANRELESKLRTEKIKTKHYRERLKEFTIIVDETDAIWRKKDLHNKAYIEYLNALLANNEDSMRHEEALEENAARDGYTHS